MSPADPSSPQQRNSRFQDFLRSVVASNTGTGLLLLVAAIVALVWVNSPWSHSYHALWHSTFTLGFGSRAVTSSLEQWVNDGLMVVFFLLVGLEIKRELLLGELASVRRATLPVVAAIGGMVVPALIYAALNAHGAGSAGWGVPMATDIAFAIGAIRLVGRSLPTSAAVFLLAVAIVDDLGAVLVIALFYTKDISIFALGAAAACFAILVALNAFRVHRIYPYLIVGFGLWWATLASGVHATVAGVLLAFTIPATRSSSGKMPLEILEHALIKPVGLFIVPVFALANAGVDFRSTGAAAIASPITWGIILGLVLGKPIGILGACWISIRARIASLPAGTTWRQLFGISVLCGIGFTMSLFVANLAFPGSEEHLGDAKFGILAASVVAAVSGGVLVRSTRRLQSGEASPVAVHQQTR